MIFPLKSFESHVQVVWNFTLYLVSLESILMMKNTNILSSFNTHIDLMWYLVRNEIDNVSDFAAKLLSSKGTEKTWVH